MADPYANRPVSAAMGLGLRVPSAGFNSDPSMSMGLSALRPTRADTAVVGTSIPPPPEQALGGLKMRNAQQLESMMALPPIAAPDTNAQKPATAYFNAATNEMFAGDRQFSADDTRSALTASQSPGNTTKPVGPGWTALPEGAYGDYVASFAQRRGKMELIGRGIGDVAEGTIGGVGALMEFAGATEAGPAVREFAQGTFGQSENEQLRDQLISQNSTLMEKIIDGTFRAIPSVASVFTGGGAAGLGARALGAGATGIKAAATIGGGVSTFPLHVDSYYESAVQNGYDPTDPQIKTEIIGGALANTALDMFGISSATGKIVSRALRQTAEEAGKKAARGAIFNGVMGGAKTGFSEALTETMQAVGETALFDPNVREMWDAGEIKALAPYLSDTYGEQYVIAAGIGAFLGGGMGTVANLRATKAKTVPAGDPINLTDTASNQTAPDGEMQGPERPMQGPMPLGEMFGPERPMQGPMPLGEMQGPAPLGRMQGPIDIAREGPKARILQSEARQAAEAARGAQADATLATTVEANAAAREQQRIARQAAATAGGVQADANVAARLENRGTRAGQLYTGNLLAAEQRFNTAREALVAAQGTNDRIKIQRAGAEYTAAQNELTSLRNRVEDTGATALNAGDVRVGPMQGPAPLGEMQGPAPQTGNAPVEAPVFPAGPAIWASADVDYPVEVLPEPPQLGPDGRYYQKVRPPVGPDTFVPFDELRAAPAPTTKTKPLTKKQKAEAKKAADAAAAAAPMQGPMPLGPMQGPAPLGEMFGPPAPKALTKAQKAAAKKAADAAAAKSKVNPAVAAQVQRFATLTPEQQGAVLTKLNITDPAQLVTMKPEAVKAAIDSVLTPPTGGGAPKGETLRAKPAVKPAVASPAPKAKEVALKPPATPKPRAEAGPAITGARTRASELSAAAQDALALKEAQQIDETTAGGAALTPKRSAEEIAAQKAAEKTAKTAADTRETITKADADRRAIVEAGKAVGEQDLSTVMVAEVDELIADVKQAVADGDTFARDTALFELRRMSDQRAKGLRGTELGAAMLNQRRAAEAYIDSLPEEDQQLADELFQKFGKIGTVEEIVVNADTLNDAVGGLDAVTRLNALLDEFVINRDRLQNGFMAKFRDTAIEVKKLGAEGRTAMRGTAPLLSYINERNEPNWQRGNLTPRDGMFALADPGSITNAVDLDGNPVSAIAPGRVQLLVRNFVAKLARAPRVTIARNQADLKARFPDIYARAVAARPQGDFDTAPAMGYAFGTDEVVVFSDRIVTEQQLRFVLAHETLGHFGLRGIMPGQKFDALMELVYKGDSRTQRAVDAAMDMNPRLSQAEAVEEYLSDYAAVLDTSIVARIWNGIKGFLNTLGVRTGDEMTRYLLDQARRYARTKKGAAFDARAVGERLHAVESLGDTGRFSTAPSYRDVNTTAGLLRDNIGGLPMSIEEGWNYLKGQRINSATTWDEAKVKFLSLANFRARENPGLAKLEDLIDQTRNIAMSLKVSYNERLRLVLNRAIAGEVGGISDKQTDTVNQMLYAGQRAAVAKTKAAGDQGNVPLFTMVNGKLTKNAPEIARLRKIGHRSLEEMRDGFEYDVTFDEAGKTIDKKEKFAGIKGLTKDSIEWRGYIKVREAMDDIELELLRARYEGAFQERDLAFRQIAATVPDGELSADEREAMTTLAQTYGSLYTSNIKQDTTGRAVLDVDYQTYANDILRTANSALIGEESDRFDTLRRLLTEDRVFLDKDNKVRTTLPAVMKAQMADDLIAKLQAFKSRAKLGGNTYVVQNKIKQVILSDIASKDADKYTKRTISTGYTPILREGRYQMRVQAYVGNKIVRLQDSYREQLVYSQFDAASESMEAVQKTNALFGNNTFEVMAYDQDAGKYTLQNVQLRAVSERALDAIAAPPELNLNEFIRGLRQFDIALTPAKMEDVVVALTKQNSNARNRLERSFTPGAKMDGVMATMRHIESRASTVSKVMMRPQLAELMDRSMESTNLLWNGDPKLLAKLKSRAEALAANPTARKEEIADARREYEQYAYMYNKTNPSGGLPVKGNQYYNEASSTVAFLDGNKNVDESDFGSGPMVSRIRAATSMMQLGGSIATGALNLLSLVTNGVPYLASYNPKTAFGGGFGTGNVLAAMSVAAKQVGAPGITSREANTAEFYDKVAGNAALQKQYGLNAREAAFIAKEIREGNMIPAQTNALQGSARGRTTSGFMQKFQDGWMWTFNVTEQASRRTLGLAAYRLEFARRIAAGKTEAEADTAATDFAGNAMKYTMGEYSVLNRPPAWRSGIQSFMYMYKVYPTTSVQLFANLSRNGKIGMIAGIVLLSGISGLPFAEDLEDLADTLAQRLKISGWRGARFETAKFIDSILPGMSTELLKGFVNEYVPADIAGRTSLGNLLPGTDILLAGADPMRGLSEIFGPAPSMLTGTATFAADLLALPFSKTLSIEDVARESPVTALRALGDTYAYLQSGNIVDRRGYVVSDQMTTGTLLARAMGFYPAAAAKQYEIIRSAKRMTDYQREVATGFRTAWIKATTRGDRDRARAIEEAVEDWNAGSKGTALEVRDFVANSKKALKEASRTAVERTLRSAPDAAERDLQQMIDLLTAN